MRGEPPPRLSALGLYVAGVGAVVVVFLVMGAGAGLLGLAAEGLRHLSRAVGG